MKLMSQVLLTEAIESFRQTYEDFLKIMELADEAVVQVGFYTGAIEMVRQNPIPDTEVQEELLKYLEQMRKDSLGDADDDLISSIKITYQNISRGRLVERHEGHNCEVMAVDSEQWKKWMT